MAVVMVMLTAENSTIEWEATLLSGCCRDYRGQVWLPPQLEEEPGPVLRVD